MKNCLISSIVFLFLMFIISLPVHSAPNYYPITPSKNKFVIGTGLGLESGMIGLRMSRWLNDPNVIVNCAVGLEGITPVLRLPLVNAGNYDFFLDMASLFTPGLLGFVSGDDGGVLFSKNTFLLGTGLGIQRWVRKRTDYGFYLSAGMTYWVQVSGSHEGSGDVGWSPEFQIGVIY